MKTCLNIHEVPALELVEGLLRAVVKILLGVSLLSTILCLVVFNLLAFRSSAVLVCLLCGLCISLDIVLILVRIILP